MSKRELEQLNSGSEIEGPRMKRRRETTVATSSEVDTIQPDPVGSGSGDAGRGHSASRELIMEEGLKLWQTVRDAVNKEGRPLSVDFLRRPSKRQYPDYYEQIQRPIALDEIKKKIENGGYPSLGALKEDFDLCFNNAKHYNMKDSTIWNDAKELQKLVSKTYSKMVSADEDGENAENAEGDGKRKPKGPNLTRLMKARLQKLVDKTDETGRVLSTEFMELPSKKEWPLYYKTIKKPQCLENIFKRIKRKEYQNAGEFAADVELVFNNALSFNQEHTTIWEDAKALCDYFRQLMSDMPAPFTLPEYTKPTNGKIRIKMPSASQLAASASSSGVSASTAAPVTQTSPPLVLRVPIPAASLAKASPAPTSASDAAAPSTEMGSNATLPPPVAAMASIPTQPAPSKNSSLSHYPGATYTPAIAPLMVTSTSTLPVSNALPRTHSSSRSPAPSSNNLLKSVTLSVQPTGRMMHLDFRDGVKCWAVRLVPGEVEVHISRVTFLDEEEEEEEESCREEEDDDAEGKPEGEEEKEDGSEDGPKTTRKKVRVKGRGRRPTKAVTAKATPHKRKKQKVLVRVTLNGAPVSEEQDMNKWVLQPSLGMNVVEFGESGRPLWKVYIQRLA